jgi:glycosyltransferase involved in cell wall biosynthesis
MAEQAGIGNNVVFMDFVKEPQKLMQLCDCILLASFEETFGLVLPEAMRSGVAVIGSNKGGVPEIIEHEKTGLLFVSGDANSLYQQIKRLYRNEAFKIQLANNGKVSADERFNTEKHFEQLEQHFTNLLQSD